VNIASDMIKIASDVLRFEDKEEHVPASEREVSEFSHEFEKVYGGFATVPCLCLPSSRGCFTGGDSLFLSAIWWRVCTSTASGTL